MPDPIDKVESATHRQQLARIRELYGQVLSSEQLRSEISGFQSQKGIYKPGGSEYALWVRQTARGVYPDKEPTTFEDGSWSFRYAPEGRAGVSDMGLDTNRALVRCHEKGIPVGVFRQTAAVQGRTSYEVLGLAYVEDFDGTHFLLRGEPIDWTVTPEPESVIPVFEPLELGTPSLAESVRLIRDQRFGVVIRRLYHDQCSLCQLGFRLRGRSVGLEAAHIIPVESRGNLRDVRNGVLLCRNHHSLFDLYAWTMDEDLRVQVADDAEFRKSAEANHVLKFEGVRLPNLPTAQRDYPATKAIEWRMKEFVRAWA